MRLTLLALTICFPLSATWTATLDNSLIETATCGRSPGFTYPVVYVDDSIPPDADIRDPICAPNDTRYAKLRDARLARLNKIEDLQANGPVEPLPPDPDQTNLNADLVVARRHMDELCGYIGLQAHAVANNGFDFTTRIGNVRTNLDDFFSAITPMARQKRLSRALGSEYGSDGCR